MVTAKQPVYCKVYNLFVTEEDRVSITYQWRINDAVIASTNETLAKTPTIDSMFSGYRWNSQSKQHHPQQ